MIRISRISCLTAALVRKIELSVQVPTPIRLNSRIPTKDRAAMSINRAFLIPNNKSVIGVGAIFPTNSRTGGSSLAGGGINKGRNLTHGWLVGPQNNSYFYHQSPRRWQ